MVRDDAFLLVDYCSEQSTKAAGKSDGSSDAASLALRIATVALSVASAAMMASASQRSSCAGCAPATQVSYSDYSSLK